MTASEGLLKPVVVITGTTASGKDRTGLEVARRIDGEIVSLDSMKVYRGLDAGTDKPSMGDRGAVPHHLIDILEPRESMDLKRFVTLAHDAITDIQKRGRTPIVVGGTALYLRGLLYGVLDGPPANRVFRESLRAEAEIKGTAPLHERLSALDPASAARIHANDYQRIERALEVIALTGARLSDLQVQWTGAPKFPARTYILTWPRDELYARIDARVLAMFEAGLVLEVQRLRAATRLSPQASAALGYAEVLELLDGVRDLTSTIELVQRNTRHFAKKQLTWFRKQKDATVILRDVGVEVSKVAQGIVSDLRDGPFLRSDALP